MPFTLADRVKNLPPYLFAELDRLKAEQVKKGVDVIDLGVADPDLPTPPHIIKALQKAAEDPENHRYPAYTGMNRFRESAAGWMKRRFGVTLEPLAEVLTLIGSKEGISNFPLAFVNPGDVVLIPSPGYPPYTSGTLFAGGKPYFLPLKRENNFLPDLKSIPQEVVKKARIIHINYPNNPTAAIANLNFFEEVVQFARKNNIIVCHDAAYSEQYDKEPSPSFLQVDGAREVGIEFHSLSKTFNMTGWRIGFACGNRDLIAGLGKIKTNVDSGAFQAVQWAGIAALEENTGCIEEIRGVYRQRRKLTCEGLKRLGWDIASSAAAITLWVAVPKGYDSARFSKKVLEEVGVVITPGNGFGEGGEGYVRISLTCSDTRLQEAVERLGRLKI
ncbi:MAG: LL-diaminopimelate aminotransferase [Deltaproteobacteria bacterium]|nr:LL-diaminopimelate aminotransferase [Deltaproteobacteria bacterium]